LKERNSVKSFEHKRLKRAEEQQRAKIKNSQRQKEPPLVMFNRGRIPVARSTLMSTGG